MFQRVPLSQPLTLYTHSSLSAQPRQLHKLPERGSLGKVFDQVCVCLCVLCQPDERKEKDICEYLNICVCESEK